MGRITVSAEFWNGFDAQSERAIWRNGAAFRVPIAPQVRLLKTIAPSIYETVSDDPFCDRYARAAALASDGHVIDVEIDIWGWPALDTYHFRRLRGIDVVDSISGVAQILTPPAPR